MVGQRKQPLIGEFVEKPRGLCRSLLVRRPEFALTAGRPQHKRLGPVEVCLFGLKAVMKVASPFVHPIKRPVGPATDPVRLLRFVASIYVCSKMHAGLI